jgi:hypothetical protein
MNKIFFYTTIFLIFLLGKLNAQNVSEADSLIKSAVFNYAVPDLPALNALSLDQSSLLRPSTLKDFSIATSQFFKGNSFVIPKTIAIEIAPIVFIRNNKLTLKDYKKTPILYNSRLSIGTLRDTLNISKMAIGYRTTLIDKSDIKNDKNIGYIYDFLRDSKKEFENHRKHILDSLGISLVEFALMEGSYKDTIELQIENTFNSLLVLKQKMITDSIENFKQKNLWNGEKLDIAICLVLNSPDSLMKNIHYNAFQFWVTYAHPLTKNGQFIVGIHSNFYRFENKNFIRFSIPARVYFGSNKIKSYLEGEYQYVQQMKTNNFILRLGCEYNIYSNIWVNLSGGVYQDFTNKKNKFVSEIKVAFALPNSLKL